MKTADFQCKENNKWNKRTEKSHRPWGAKETEHCFDDRMLHESSTHWNENIKTFGAIEKIEMNLFSFKNTFVEFTSRLSKSERAFWACDLKATFIFVLKQSAMSWNCVFVAVFFFISFKFLKLINLFFFIHMHNDKLIVFSVLRLFNCY